MAFSIKSLRSGEAKVFSTKQLLSLVGDPVNDEIVIDGETYRISTCQDISGCGTAAIDWILAELPVTANGQTSFYAPDFIDDADSVLLTVNNVLYTQGLTGEYHVDGDRIYWHGAFALETDDRVVLRYPLLIS